MQHLLELPPVGLLERVSSHVEEVVQHSRGDVGAWVQVEHAGQPLPGPAEGVGVGGGDVGREGGDQDGGVQPNEARHAGEEFVLIFEVAFVVQFVAECARGRRDSIFSNCSNLVYVKHL